MIALGSEPPAQRCTKSALGPTPTTTAVPLAFIALIFQVSLSQTGFAQQ
jgi:hypothetical protein